MAVWRLWQLFWTLEKGRSERWLTPMLFAAIVLLLFSFAFAGIPADRFGPSLFLGEAYLAGFLALQICYSRILASEATDGVLDLLKCYPIAPTALYLSKLLLALVMSIGILIPTFILAHVFLNVVFVTEVAVVAVLALVGLSALGVLISILTLSARGKQVLFPILYFPLTIPVLLAALEVSQGLYQGSTLGELLPSWLGLLLILDGVYLALGLILFDEALAATS